jgi:hypothetical protein
MAFVTVGGEELEGLITDALREKYGLSDMFVSEFTTKYNRPPDDVRWKESAENDRPLAIKAIYLEFTFFLGEQ